MTFGKKIKKLRIEQNLTQLQLANLLNLSKSNISKYEANSIQPNLETINSLAQIFNVSTDFLIGNQNFNLEHSTFTLGENLKYLREQQELTQDTMANYLCIKRQTYSAYERNVSVPDAITIKKIADFLNCTTDCLLGNIHKHDIPESLLVILMEELNKILDGTNLLNSKGMLTQNGIKVILEIIKNNKGLLNARLKELEEN